MVDKTVFPANASISNNNILKSTTPGRSITIFMMKKNIPNGKNHNEVKRKQPHHTFLVVVYLPAPGRFFYQWQLT